MADFTVADIIDAQPSLIERAKIAHEYEAQLVEDQQRKEREDLTADTYDFLYDVLKMRPSELQDIEFEAGRFNDVREMLSWRIEGVDFRSRYMTKEYQRGVTEFDLVVEVNPRSTSAFKAVTSLSSLGSILA